MKKTNYTLQQIIDAYAKLNYKTQVVNIFGIRTTINAQQNKFDDTLGVLIIPPVPKEPPYAFPTLNIYSGTTDPGNYWLANYQQFNKIGTAAYVPGQYLESHAIGRHLNQYPAWVQVGTVSAYRDGDKDNVLDMDPKTITKGANYGMNVHHAGVNALAPSQNVDMWSAGCLVYQDINDWNEAFTLGRSTAALYKQARFHLTIFLDTQVLS